MGPLPSGGAKRYGDKYFTAMMYAKVRYIIICVANNLSQLFSTVESISR
jgi:hypothetical protein